MSFLDLVIERSDERLAVLVFFLVGPDLFQFALREPTEPLFCLLDCQGVIFRDRGALLVSFGAIGACSALLILFRGSFLVRGSFLAPHLATHLAICLTTLL